MAANRDWYPAKVESLPEWYQNFTTQIQTLSAKYGITTDQVTTIQADNAWIQYWVPAISSANAQFDNLNEYFKTIWKATTDTPEPKVPVLTLPAGAPAKLAAGISTRTRDVANFIKGNPLYSQTDGELLRIVSQNGEPRPPSEITAEFKLRALANFSLEVTFTRQGQDAIHIEYRRKGGAWTLATTLTSSPGVFSIDPLVAGQSEQVEVRGILLKKNLPVGNFSDIKNAFIAP